MSILRFYVFIAMVSVLQPVTTVLAQVRPLPTPPAPKFPAEDQALLTEQLLRHLPESVELPPIPEPLVAEAETEVATDAAEELLPTEALPDPKVRAEIEPQPLPDQAGLVSILKRELPVADETVAVRDTPDWFQALLQRIVRENIPDKYVQEKDWGKTDRRWDGLDVRRKGVLRWSTKRKWKEVNHGTWKRYEISQIAPQENLNLRINNIREVSGGRVGFDVLLTSKLHVLGRLAKWTKGVQLYSVSADADAYVVLQMGCTLGVRLDIGKFPPDVILSPSVTSADIDVRDFELQQLSKLRGPLVRELSNSVRKALEERVEEKRDRLPEKINRQIAKKQDRLRVSFADFAKSKWAAVMPTQSAKVDTSDQAKGKTDSRTGATSQSDGATESLVREARRPTLKLVGPNGVPAASNSKSPDTTTPGVNGVELLDLMPAEGDAVWR